MDTALITALAAVLGSAVGGSATVAAAWVSQRTLNRRELIRMELQKRETLYGEFINECSRLALDALTHGLDKPESMVIAYAVVNRIRFDGFRRSASRGGQCPETDRPAVFHAQCFARRGSHRLAGVGRRSAPVISGRRAGLN